MARSAAIFALTTVGLWAYYRYSFAKTRRQEQLQASHFGEAKLGGHYTLTDHDGHRFSSLDNLKDTYSLVYFGFTHCPDVCPEELEVISKVTSIVEKKVGKRFRPIFITVDPERDQPPQIKEYLKDFHPSFVGLTGTSEEIRQVAKLFRVYYRPSYTSSNAATKDYLVDHSIFFFLMDPNGKFLQHFGRDTTPEKCAAEILNTIQS